MTLTDRVKAGMILLDQKRPGWEKEIDLDRLNMGDTCDCVLGQLYGTVQAGYGELEDIAGDDFVKLDEGNFGFNWQGLGKPQDYLTLDAEWLKQITKRLAK